MLLCQPLAKPAKCVLIGQLEIVLNFDHVEPAYTDLHRLVSAVNVLWAPWQRN